MRQLERTPKAEHLTDFRQIQRQHRRRKLLTRLGIFTVAVLCIMGLFTWMRKFHDVSLQSVLEDLLPAEEADGLPVTLSVGDVRTLRLVGNKIGVLGDSGFALYSANGDKQRDFRHNYYNPVIEVGDHRVLLYDRDGMNLRVEGGNKTLYTKTYENSIITADINGKGIMAVATGSNRYKGEVFVYNKDFENIFNWGCSSGRVLCLDLTEKNNRMAVGTVETSGGMLRSVVNLFKFTSDEEAGRVTLDDQLLLSLDYKGKDHTLYAVTNKNVYALSSDGAILHQYSFDGKALWAFDNTDDGGLAIALGDYQEQRELEIIRLDRTLTPSTPYLIEEHMLGLTCDGDDIYLLTDNFLSRFDESMQLKNTYDIPDARVILPVKGQIYYATNRRLSQAEANQ